MRRADTSARHSRQGFTLIELLVVVAIIALLISILLPSLSKARAQARTTLCASRVSQLTKAALIYAEDYDGRPPFIGTGDFPDDVSDGGSENIARVNAENWVTRNQWYVANNPEEDWPALIQGTGDTWMEGYVPRSGMLFPYTRFDSLYVCPEFQRQGDASKTQNTFNITRTILARKWWVPQLDPDTPADLAQRSQMLGVMGELLPLSSIFVPGKLEMMIDEHWKYHVGDCVPEFPRLGGAWMGSDPVWWGAQSEIGQYHGAPIMGFVAPFANEPGFPPNTREAAVKRGNVSYYDGHVDLERDFLPGKNAVATLLDERAAAVIDWVTSHRYFQRGRDVGDISALLP